jgi:hypothetical protein
MQSEADLAEIVAALSASSCLTCGLKGRQKQRYEQPYKTNNDHQLNDGETPFSHQEAPVSLLVQSFQWLMDLMNNYLSADTVS